MSALGGLTDLPAKGRDSRSSYSDIAAYTRRIYITA